MAWDNEKKKVKTAVAVAYEPGDKAPKILASGRVLQIYGMACH